MVYNESISLQITAGDLGLVQVVIPALLKLRPVRTFLSTRHRPIALGDARLAPEDRGWSTG